MGQILEVDGIRTPAEAMVKKLQRRPVAKLLVERGNEFKVSLRKAADCLGMDVGCKATRECLVIRSILEEGIVHDWNAAHPEKQLKAEDYIVEVNGTRGPAKMLLDIMKCESRLDMTVVSS